MYYEMTPALVAAWCDNDPIGSVVQMGAIILLASLPTIGLLILLNFLF